MNTGVGTSTIKDRRIGRFRIYVESINDHPDTCHLIFAQVIVLDCNVMLHSDQIEYTAINSAFRSVEVGGLIPAYLALVNSVDQSIEWREYTET